MSIVMYSPSTHRWDEKQQMILAPLASIPFSSGVPTLLTLLDLG